MIYSDSKESKLTRQKRPTKEGSAEMKNALYPSVQRVFMRFFLKNPGIRLRQAALPSVPGNLGMKRSKALSRYTQLPFYNILRPLRKR